MKKIMSLLLVAVCVICGGMELSVYAEDRSVDSYNMHEIQDIVEEYFEENNIDIEINTQEFYEYAFNQIVSDNIDENLKNHPDYNLIFTYMVRYYLDICDKLIEDEIKMKEIEVYATSDYQYNPELYYMTEEELDKTIGEIKAENDRNNNNKNGITTYSNYNASAAVDYARRYAYIYNDDYYSFQFSGGDCANFVSQALYAGGFPMHGSRINDIKETTSEWFHYKVLVDYTGNTPKYIADATTSFVRARDLATYLNSKGTKSICTKYNQFNNTSRVGSVFFLQDKTSKTPYHAMIVTKKDSSGIYYSAHTNNKKDYPVADAIDFSVKELVNYNIY